MQRYFIEKIDISNNQAILTDGDFHHVKNVMRGRIGDEIIVCDYEVCYQVTITDITKKEIITILDTLLEQKKQPYKCDIAQALIRRERFEYMLQKATELGVNTIIPTNMKNSIIKLQDNKKDNKVTRWNAITKEASEQSHRSTLSSVSDIKALKELNYKDYDIVLVAYEKEAKSTSLKEVLKDTYQNILVVIGPEGGFDPKEIEYLESLENAKLIGLGPRILRSETASSYILSVLSYEYEMII